MLLDRLNSLHINIRNYLLDNMLAASEKYDRHSLNILIAAGAIAVISIIVGLIFILHMKNKYLKEVYILTLLNENMIMKNKRI